MLNIDVLKISTDLAHHYSVPNNNQSLSKEYKKLVCLQSSSIKQAVSLPLQHVWHEIKRPGQVSLVKECRLRS